MLARLERVLWKEHLVSGRHGHEQVGCERLLSSCDDRAMLLGCPLPAPGVDVVERHVAPTSKERSRRRDPVHARADDGRGLRVRAAERLRREYRGRTCAQRRHGACVESGTQRSVRCVRKEHEPHHGRQPLSRIARERRHPFQKCMSASERGHRAEVPGRVGGHVDLRRHRPLAARICHERAAYGLERALRRDCGSNLLRRKDRYPAHTDLTAAISFSIAAFASSNSITVFGS